MRLLTVLFFLFTTLLVTAQNKTATVNGRIIDENENALANVTVTILGKNSGILSSDSGTFSLKVNAEKSFAITCTHTGYLPVQKNFFLSPGETEQVTIRMIRAGKTAL